MRITSYLFAVGSGLILEGHKRDVRTDRLNCSVQGAKCG